MNDFRFSACPLACTCSAEMMVPWMISSSTPAAIAGPASVDGVLRGQPDRDRAAAVPHASGWPR